MKAPNPGPEAESVKLALLPDLAYEVWMLGETQALATQVKGRDVTNFMEFPDFNAFLESFITHARVLIEFLFYPPEGNYLRARHYVKTPLDPALHTLLLKDVVNRVSTDAVHLSSARARASNWAWDTEAILRDVLAAFREFQNMLGDPYKTELAKFLPDKQFAVPSKPAGILAPAPPGLTNALRTHPPPPNWQS